MIKKIMLVALTIPKLYCKEIVHPWVSQWDHIAQSDVELYTQYCNEVLNSTSQKIKSLLVQYAGARIPKGHVFNAQLQDILKTNTAQLIRKSRLFAHKIQAEAQNTFDYKINHRIHHALKPTSTHSTKNIRPNRRVLGNHHNKFIP